MCLAGSTLSPAPGAMLECLPVGTAARCGCSGGQPSALRSLAAAAVVPWRARCSITHPQGSPSPPPTTLLQHTSSAPPRASRVTWCARAASSGAGHDADEPAAGPGPSTGDAEKFKCLERCRRGRLTVLDAGGKVQVTGVRPRLLGPGQPGIRWPRYTSLPQTKAVPEPPCKVLAASQTGLLLGRERASAHTIPTLMQTGSVPRPLPLQSPVRYSQVATTGPGTPSTSCAPARSATRWPPTCGRTRQSL